jgi:nicotinamide riboside kinase
MKIEVDYAFNNKIPSVEVTGKNYLHDFSQVLDLISEVMGKEEDKTSNLIV